MYSKSATLQVRTSSPQPYFVLNAETTRPNIAVKRYEPPAAKRPSWKHLAGNMPGHLENLKIA
jgi:hypothetical protein